MAKSSLPDFETVLFLLSYEHLFICLILFYHTAVCCQYISGQLASIFQSLRERPRVAPVSEISCSLSELFINRDCSDGLHSRFTYPAAKHPSSWEKHCESDREIRKRASGSLARREGLTLFDEDDVYAGSWNFGAARPSHSAAKERLPRKKRGSPTLRQYYKMGIHLTASK